jgi:hypothetical protein
MPCTHYGYSIYRLYRSTDCKRMRCLHPATSQALTCHAMPCQAVPGHATSCSAMPCHATPRHAMPCALRLTTDSTDVAASRPRTDGVACRIVGCCKMRCAAHLAADHRRVAEPQLAPDVVEHLDARQVVLQVVLRAQYTVCTYQTVPLTVAMRPHRVTSNMMQHGRHATLLQHAKVNA